MFYSILLLALLFGSAEMCGNLVQSNAPSKQSDVGAVEGFAEVTFKVATSCEDFINALDDAEKKLLDDEHCTPKSGAHLKLKATPKTGTCEDARKIAMNAQKKVLPANYASATFTCHGSEMHVPAK